MKSFQHIFCINKDLKEAIAYPTEAYLQKTSLFLNRRIITQKQFLSDIFPEKYEVKEPVREMVVDQSTKSKEVERNIMTMMNFILSKNMVNHSPGRTLMNPFSLQVASNEQRHDLLGFCKIGEEATVQYISTQLLQLSSSSGIVRRKKLLTMSSQPAKKNKRKAKSERENETVIKCLRRRLAWCQRNNYDFSLNDEMYSIYPRALSDENGTPHKSAKSHWNDKLRSCFATYKPEVFSNVIASSLVPEAVVLDAMFLIITKPLRNNKTVPQFTKQLFVRFIQEHLRCGVSEVHIVFD